MDPTDRKDQLTGKSHLVRLYEANAAIQFPTDHDLAFRSMLTARLTVELGLTPTKTVPQRIAQPARS